MAELRVAIDEAMPSARDGRYGHWTDADSDQFFDKGECFVREVRLWMGDGRNTAERGRGLSVAD
ncbi:MAG: hypothetical protein JWL58_3837 [Streptosporangiaceae bacterium]|nr:hypothetical protein [Streptosporangiaceae bacterium]